MKAKKTAKQIAAATKNILAYEKKDDFTNITKGFVIGFSVCLMAVCIGIGFSSLIGLGV